MLRSNLAISLTTLLSLAGCAADASQKGDLDAIVDDVDSAVRDAALSADSARAPTLVGRIDSGETVMASFSSRAKYLAWTFDATEGQTIRLTAAGVRPASLDTVLLLYRATSGGRPTERALAINDDYDGNVSSYVELGAPETRGYVAIVRRYDLGTSGTVSLSLDLEGDDAPCGSRGLGACGDGRFCDYTVDAMCGAADHPGVCREIPTVCTREFAPVCGCDGSTYSNACNAHARGVAVLHDGDCSGGGDCPATGVLCTPDCADGRTPGGAPCTRGNFDRASCTCVPLSDCPLTGVLCTLDCTDGRTPGGAPCTRGTWDAASCTCTPASATCGGFAGLRCASGEYCDYPAGAMCGAADRTGTCRPRPDVCITLYRPVCGCDGRTHSNSCVAHRNGADVAHDGPC